MLSDFTELNHFKEHIGSFAGLLSGLRKKGVVYSDCVVYDMYSILRAEGRRPCGTPTHRKVFANGYKQVCTQRRVNRINQAGRNPARVKWESAIVQQK